MRFSPIALAALVPLLSSVFGYDTKCTDGEGKGDHLAWWPELEIPQGPTSRAGEVYDFYMVKKLGDHNTDFEMSVFSDDFATINIYNNHGRGLVYRVKFKDEIRKDLKSFIFQSNSDPCESPLPNVPFAKVKHVTVEMLK
jgi:hypothetical protein